MKSPFNTLLSYQYNTIQLSSTFPTLFVLLTTILLTLSCGPMPSQRLPIPETSSSEITTITQTANIRKLPKAAIVDLKEIVFLKDALKIPVTSVSSKSGLEDFHVRNRRNVRYSVLISNCNFDILKAFIAQGWAPIVKYEYHARKWEIIPISEYSDHTNMVSLQQVNGNAKRRIDYKDFESSFARSSRNQCVLISRIQLSEANIHKVLSKYLPRETYAQISIKSR
ncbi:hypothetical protein C6497_14000 [Candidatus Poribacteria bacterium]|nr:MAG: hypothetical protein C6497_14000 [Candidatus Poribacteria bacterium]